MTELVQFVYIAKWGIKMGLINKLVGIKVGLIEKFTKWITGDKRFNSDRRKHIMIGYKKSNRREKERRE